MDSYTVFKRTATHADVLAAIGAADLLGHLSPRIIQFEDRFDVKMRRDLRPSDIDLTEPGFSFFVKGHSDKPDASVETGGDTIATVLPRTTPASIRMYSILGRMKAYGGPNKVVLRYEKLERGKWIRSVWESLHGRPGFVLSTSLVQLFNPQSGKGYALPKPNGTSRDDKTKDRWAEPFLEWLRYRGFFQGSAGWFASGDFRLYCPVPANIAYDDFSRTVSAFRELRLGGTAVKMDCRAILGLTRLLIENSAAYRRPRESLAGVWVTHYKDMGQAHTFMAMDQLAIPDWFDLKNSQQSETWLRVLDEHDTILRRLTDSHSDEFALLKQYRRCFQLRWQESISEFLEFLMGYGILLFKRRAQDHWVLPQMSVSGISAILTRDSDLRKALHDPGFLAVAAAIRSSTVGAQAYRHGGAPDRREVRYGLLSDIRRAGLRGNQEILRTVSAFVSVFNRESVTLRAAGRGAMQIRDGELETFAALLGRLPSGVSAGSLLCGVATAIPGDGAQSETGRTLLQAASA